MVNSVRDRRIQSARDLVGSLSFCGRFAQEMKVLRQVDLATRSWSFAYQSRPLESVRGGNLNAECGEIAR